MTLAERLFARNQDLVEACRRHPFVLGIATGAVPRDRFRFYVGQDAYFLDAYARAYALALAKAPDRDTLARFRTLLDGVEEELRLHRSYAESWGITLNPAPAPATRAYCDFLLRVAWSEPAGRIVAAMTPCMRLYQDLGTFLVTQVHPESPYRAWVDTYSAPAFLELTATLETLLNTLAPDDPITADDYRYAMALERRFFDAAWEADGPAD
jgi:thiaminase/transcriptional activator TenA